jgi:hypothetical protein
MRPMPSLAGVERQRDLRHSWDCDAFGRAHALLLKVEAGAAKATFNREREVQRVSNTIDGIIDELRIWVPAHRAN